MHIWVNGFILLLKANHISAPKCIQYCRGLDWPYAVLTNVKCTCAVSHTIDLTQPVVTVPLTSGETNPIRPFSKCGRSAAMTMIGDATAPETIALYRIGYNETWSGDGPRYAGSKIGSSTCNAVTKELMLTRYECFSPPAVVQYVICFFYVSYKIGAFFCIIFDNILETELIKSNYNTKLEIQLYW